MDILIVALKRDELTLASFRPKRGGVSFLAAERHPLTGGEEELSRLLEAAARVPGERRVVLALPPSQLFMRELELPLTDRAKVRELLPLELKGETALDTDELSFDALQLATGRFLAVWGRSKEIQESIELLKGAGLEPEAVTASLYHWDKIAPAAGTVAVTDGEALAAYRDAKPIYFRALRPGSGEQELERTVAALEVAHGVKVERIVSFARTSTERGVLAQSRPALAEAFADDAHAAHDLAGAYAVAVACADGSLLNLRRGELAYTAGTQKLYRKLRLTAGLAAAVVLLVFAESGVRFALAKRDVASLDKSIQAIYKDVFPGRKKPVDEVAEVRAEIRKLEGAKVSSNLLKFLKDLAVAKGDGVTGFYETELDGTDVRLKGEARSFQAANDFKGRAATLVDGAEVTDIKSRPDGSVTFSFRGKLKGVAQ
ncbi:type II secretion system protein GspL [Geomonas silvestris]|uniref:Type II secretion system protein GspL n=1 Tax=Geomonas silvestris TaxID=2740184 RepID=A0A6V8MIM5_9BACT|nr:type II secretion system protein GspL [Geomonas silvestris]GFO59818.1 type II secretion system protein GspL [Geomonas silvestris]